MDRKKSSYPGRLVSLSLLVRMSHCGIPSQSKSRHLCWGSAFFSHGYLILLAVRGHVERPDNKCHVLKSHCLSSMYDVLFYPCHFLSGSTGISWAWLYEELKTIDGCVSIGRGSIHEWSLL